MGEAYKRLITQWRDVLPTQSLCLTVPIVMPQDAEGEHAAKQRERAKQMIERLPAQPATQENG